LAIELVLAKRKRCNRGLLASGYPKMRRKPGMLWNPATAAASLEDGKVSQLPFKEVAN
jgi:hypothetical protein